MDICSPYFHDLKFVSPHLEASAHYELSRVPNIINSAPWQERDSLKIIRCCHCPFSRKKAENSGLLPLFFAVSATLKSPRDSMEVCGLCTSLPLKFFWLLAYVLTISKSTMFIREATLAIWYFPMNSHRLSFYFYSFV